MSLETELFVRAKKSAAFTNIFANKLQQCKVTPQSQVQKTTTSEMQVIAEQNYLQGRQDGIDQAAESATRQAKQYFDNEMLEVQHYISQVENCIASLEDNMHNDVLRLSLAIAQKITMTQLTLNSVAVLPIIHSAIEMLPSRSVSYQIRLNPLDAERIEQYLQTHYKDGQISLVADESIHVGGAIISTETNQVDATYEQRWNQIAHTLGVDCEWVKA